MLQFIQRFFGKPPSSATARERLRLVLLSDHLSLAPDVVEALKHDLIEVISRYLEVDVPNCDVTFEQREKEVAMLANIPILGMHPRPVLPPQPPAPPPPSNGSGTAFEPAAADAAVAVAEPEPAPAAPRTPKTKSKPNGVPNGHRPPRRKRRKGVGGTAPATG